MTTPLVVTDARGQTRMAMRFAAEHHNQVRYIHGLGWHVWCGTHWQPDGDGLPYRLAIRTVSAARKHALNLPKHERDALWSDAHKCDSASGLRGLLEIASTLTHITVPVGRLNQDPYLFNTLSGTLDLRTSEVIPHSRDHFITQVAGTVYDPDAIGVNFLRFLEQILPDQTVRDYVQMLVGYSMLGIVKEHVLPLFIGASRNGKTVLLEAVSRTFGNYAMSAAPSLLIERDSRASTTDRADLMGKRFVVCSESDEGNRFAAGTVKLLTGADTIKARKMYRDNIEFTPSHTIFMMTNHEPIVDGADSAIFERIRRVNFTQRFVGRDQDPDLPEKLQAELSVILRWAVEGYRRYAVQGLHPPAPVVDAGRSYALRHDAVGRFVDQCCVEHPEASVGFGELYAAWSAWQLVNDGPELSKIALSKRLDQRGYRRTRTRRDGYSFAGIGLKLGVKIKDEDDQTGGLTC